MPITLNTNALVSLNQLKLELNIVTSTDDDFLNQSINFNSQLVEDELQHAVKAADYAQVLGLKANGAYTQQYPVTAVYSFAYYSDVAMHINYSGSGIDARVGINSGNFYLQATYADGSAVNGVVSGATAKTASLLASGISAIGSGFNATVVNDTLFTNLYPINWRNVKGVVNSEILYASTEDNNWVLNDRQGWFNNLNYHMPWIYALVKYRAGYDSVPQDLQKYCLQLCARDYLARGRDPTMKSVSLGDYSYTLGELNQELDRQRKVLLAQYKRIIVG